MKKHKSGTALLSINFTTSEPSQAWLLVKGSYGPWEPLTALKGLSGPERMDLLCVVCGHKEHLGGHCNSGESRSFLSWELSHLGPVTCRMVLHTSPRCWHGPVLDKGELDELPTSPTKGQRHSKLTVQALKRSRPACWSCKSVLNCSMHPHYLLALPLALSHQWDIS